MFGLTSLLLFLPAASADPLSIEIEHAVQVHVTPQGLGHVGDAVEALMPQEIGIEDATGSLECDSSTSIDYSLAAFDILLSTDAVLLDTSTGELTLSLFATLDSEATTAVVTGDCAILTNLNETCDLQLPTTGLEASFTMALASTPSGFDATVSDVGYSFTPITNPLDNCLLASAVGTLLGQNPDAIGDLLADALGPALDDLAPTVEEAVEDALNSLDIDLQVDLLGSPMTLSVTPDTVAIDDRGLVVGLAAGVGLPEVAQCASDLGDPVQSTPDWPAVDATAWDTSLEYDLGAFISRDLTDAILHTLMASGALCLEVDELNGAPLTTDLVGAFFGGELVEITGEGAPARIAIEPGPAPLTAFDEDQPIIRAGVHDLGISLVSQVDYRAVRIATVDVDADLGIEVDLVDGVLAAGLEIDPGSITVQERPSEWLSPGYGLGVGGLVDFALGSFLPDELLPEVALPDLKGARLSRLVWLPSDDGEWQSAYTVVDTTDIDPLVVEGCDISGLGCDGGPGIDFDVGQLLGCDAGGDDCGGCSSVTVPARVIPVWVVVMGVLVRRRRGS